MRIYCVKTPLGEYDPEGVDSSEWFASKVEALNYARRFVRDVEDSRELREHEVEIEWLEVARMSPKKLLLAALNRRGWVEARGTVTTLIIPDTELEEEES